MKPTTIRTSHLAICLLLLSLLLTAAPPRGAMAQAVPRCFPETDYCIDGRIREFWEQNGGLPIFGYPTTPQREELIEGRPFQVQWFERNRLELHPENARPYDVLLGRLGADRLAQQGRDWQNFSKSQPQAGARYFAETGHIVSGEILNAWRSRGLEFDGQRGTSEAESLALFGLPLSDVQTETIEGSPFQVQWFERARFELHPENQAPYNVLLGLLGNEVKGSSAPTAPDPQPAAPPPQAAEPCGGIPAPTNAAAIPGTCVPQGTPVLIGAYGFAPQEGYSIVITDPSGAATSIPPESTISGDGKLLEPFPTDGFAPGTWTITFVGANSARRATIPLKVLPAGQPLPVESFVLVLPPHGAIGTRFDFVASGFKPGERVGIYVTRPDGSVFGATYQDMATGLGLVLGNSFTPRAADTPPGTWAITFEGIDSHHVAVGRFEIAPSRQ